MPLLLSDRVEQNHQSLEELKPFRTALTISILNPKATSSTCLSSYDFFDPNYAYPAITFTALAIVFTDSSV